MKKIILVPAIVLAQFFVFFFARPVLAQEAPATCPGGSEVNTAFGCIPIDNSTGIVSAFLRVILGIAGGIVFLMIIYAGFTFITSTGNPEKVKQAQDLMVSGFSGLIMIVFSVLLLHIVGVNILGLGLG